MRISQRVAVGGIGTALAAGLMVVCNSFHVFRFTSAAVSGLLILLVCFIAGKASAFASYAAAAAITAVLTGLSLPVISFSLFFGCYPVIREALKKLKNKIIRIVIGLLYFNAAFIIGFYIFIILLGTKLSDTIPFYIIPIAAQAVFVANEIMIFLFEREYKEKLLSIIKNIYKK